MNTPKIQMPNDDDRQEYKTVSLRHARLSRQAIGLNALTGLSALFTVLMGVNTVTLMQHPEHIRNECVDHPGKPTAQMPCEGVYDQIRQYTSAASAFGLLSVTYIVARRTRKTHKERQALENRYPKLFAQ